MNNFKFEKLKSLGFKDMHKMQVEALMSYMILAMEAASIADANRTNNEGRNYEDMVSASDELIRLFGGAGVQRANDNDKQSYLVI
jgi:hypothetical protein